MPSINDTIEQERRPRVHIKYEVEHDGAVVERELPFVVGVMGDFSGNPSTKPPPLSERRFIEIDPDNFSEVMSRMGVEWNGVVDNRLDNDGSKIAVSLKFRSIEDFEPGRIVEQVPQLKTLLEARNRLRDLLLKGERAPELEELLEEILKDPGKVSRLASELTASPGAAKGAPDAPQTPVPEGSAE